MANKKITDLLDSGQPLGDSTLLETAEEVSPSTYLSFKATLSKVVTYLSDYFSRKKETITAGENVVAGDVVYLKSDGKYWKADNLTESKIKTELRWVNSTILANATGEAYIKGLVTTTGLTAGARYYVGTDGGILEESAIPDTEGLLLRYIGSAKSTTELEFNPESDYVEITLVTGSGTGYGRSINIGQSGTVTAGSTSLTDYVYIFTGAGTLTLPTAVGNTNKYTVKNRHSSNITVTFTGGQNADGSTSIIIVPNQSLDFIPDNSNYNII